MSKAEQVFAEIMKSKTPATRQQALQRWLDAAADANEPCEHGHLGDSNEHGGACLDELCHLAEAAGLDL